MSQNFPGLAVGRIVLYVMPDGAKRPAIVTHVWLNVSEELQKRGYCNVKVFPDGANDDANIRQIFGAADGGVLADYRNGFQRNSVVFDDTLRAGSIHWPEKE